MGGWGGGLCLTIPLPLVLLSLVPMNRGGLAQGQAGNLQGFTSVLAPSPKLCKWV